MPAQITCPSCQTTLGLPTDIGPNAKLKCPKCGQVLSVPTKKALSPPMPESAVDKQSPSLSRNDSGRSATLVYIFPAASVFFALFSMALPVVMGQYIVGMILACVAALVSVAGLVVLILARANGAVIHVAGFAISAAAILLAINAIMLKASVDTQADLLTKNERSANQAKADREEANKKLAEAEDAPRKAEEILKKAEEAPKKAEAFYQMAKEENDKAKATEARTIELLAKLAEMEKSNEAERKKLVDDRLKVETAQKDLVTLQKMLDKTRKEIDEQRQELVTLKKEIDAERKAAADELAAAKKEIDNEKKKADEKLKEAKDLLKKIEGALKGAALKLKDKNIAVRIQTANALAKLPELPVGKQLIAEALVEAMLDSDATGRNAASEALEKIDPVIQPHVLTLIIGKDKHGAVRALEKLGSEARPSLPALIYCHQTGLGMRVFFNPYDLLISMTKIAPGDKRVGQVILFEISRPNPTKGLVHQGRRTGIKLMDAVEVDRKERINALLVVLRDAKELSVVKVEAIEKIESTTPDAVEAIPMLRQLKVSSDDALRKAAGKALAKIEMSK